MDPNEQRMIRESLQLSRETNILVKKIHRHLMIGRAFKAVYWIIIIGVTVGAFYFLQPYIESLQGVYGGIVDSQQNLRAFFDR